MVVGASAVAIARRIDEINSESRAVAKRIADLGRELSSIYQGPFDLASFLSLSTHPEIDTEIEETTGRLNAARKAKEVVARPQPSPLPLPSIRAMRWKY